MERPKIGPLTPVALNLPRPGLPRTPRHTTHDSRHVVSRCLSPHRSVWISSEDGRYTICKCVGLATLAVACGGLSLSSLALLVASAANSATGAADAKAVRLYLAPKSAEGSPHDPSLFPVRQYVGRAFGANNPAQPQARRCRALTSHEATAGSHCRCLARGSPRQRSPAPAARCRAACQPPAASARAQRGTC